MAESDYLPLVSVIILSYNAREYLRNCLDSVLKTDYPFLEIIVSDNNSNDRSAQMVMQNFPNVVLLENKTNLGFSRGNNVAAEISKGEIIVLLNQDTYVNKDWIREIVKVAKNPKVGVIGCKVYYPHTNVIQSVGFDVLPSGYTFPIGATKTDNGQFDKISDVDCNAGTALAIKRSALEKIGLLDPIFTYYEDTDLCFRARRADYKIVVAPRAIIYHYGVVSFGKSTLRQSYLAQKSRIIFAVRHLRGLQLLKCLTLYDIKHTITKVKEFSKRTLVLQEEPEVTQFPKNRHPKTSGLQISIINYFAGKIIAYLSILLIKPSTISKRALRDKPARYG